MNKTISSMKARDRFGELLSEVCYQGDTVTIERRGKPMAVLVPIQFLEARRQAMQRFKQAAEENAVLNHGVPEEVIEDEILQAIKEIRQDG